MSKESIYELQNIDCNCNDCIFMVRDQVRFAKWEQWAKEIQQTDFDRAKAKAIYDAEVSVMSAANEADKKSCEGVLRKAHKMRFQFDRDGLISYGHCSKFNKPVSFLPGVCQIETQSCFVHRRLPAQTNN